MRRTKQREAVLRALAATQGHPSADWVFQQVRSELPEISLGTVYRLLNALEAEGAVRVIDLPDGPARFDSRPSRHQHIACTGCGALADVPEMVSADAARRIEERTGYAVDGLRQLWYGLCPACRATSG